MTYYVGLILKDKTLIAADIRVSSYRNGIRKIKDNFCKIAQISQYAYLSGAGNMYDCGKIYKHFRDNLVKFPEDILHIDVENIRKIYEKGIQQARQENPNFEEEKGIHGYLNLSIIVGGISKENEPIMFFMNNLNGFVPQIIKSPKHGIATNMDSDVNQITQDFFRKVEENYIKLSQNPKVILNLLIDLFKNISNKDDSVSSLFDVMTVDTNGIDTFTRYNKLSKFKNSVFVKIKKLFGLLSWV